METSTWSPVPAEVPVWAFPAAALGVAAACLPVRAATLALWAVQFPSVEGAQAVEAAARR